jgi:AcrR family transcriptional regulator
MAGNRMGAQTKEKILLAAEQEFLAKGYDNARIEEIARLAGVTRAMLFYHFNSKQNIFNEIVRRFAGLVKTRFSAVMDGVQAAHPADFRLRLAAMLDFYEEQRAVLRLVLSEYISGRHSDPGTLALFNQVFNLVAGLAGKDPGLHREELLGRVFFFNALPMLAYPCLAQQFCADFNLPAEQTRETFLDAFSEVFRNNLSASAEPGRRAPRDNSAGE